jgi:hypothetical protein
MPCYGTLQLECMVALVTEDIGQDYGMVLWRLISATRKPPCVRGARRICTAFGLRFIVCKKYYFLSYFWLACVVSSHLLAVILHPVYANVQDAHLRCFICCFGKLQTCGKCHPIYILASLNYSLRNIYRTATHTPRCLQRGSLWCCSNLRSAQATRRRPRLPKLYSYLRQQCHNRTTSKFQACLSILSSYNSQETLLTESHWTQSPNLVADRKSGLLDDKSFARLCLTLRT